MEVEALAHSFFWHLQLEACNEENEVEVRNYFTEVFEDLKTELEAESPTVYQDIMSAVELRDKLLAASNYVKSRPDKVDMKSAILQKVLR